MSIKLKLIILFLLSSLSSPAQIGYQVSLLNNATGEARANEQVSVTVKITDSAGKTICEETKNETSNDFGVLSISVGNSETFSSADWSKLPFFIEATVDGRLLGKSQLLSVPIAEHANHYGKLTINVLCSKNWSCDYYDSEDKNYRHIEFTFDKCGIFQVEERETFGKETKYYYNSGTYFIDGNDLVICYSDSKEEWGYLYKFIPETNKFYDSDGGNVLQ